jgi:hypothetical protein
MMTLNGPTSDKPYTFDIVKCTATFLVLNPSDSGGATTINRLATPTTLAGSTALGGFIQASLDTHYFLTFHSKYGETDFQHVKVTTGGSGGATHVNTLTWTWPGNTFCTYASLYCAPANDPTQAVLMAEIISNQSASWTDLVGFAGVSPSGAALYQQPPSVNNAFKGGWNGGDWVNQ